MYICINTFFKYILSAITIRMIPESVTIPRKEQVRPHPKFIVTRCYRKIESHRL